MIKILLVEDESVIRQALKRLLEKNDYHVDEAASVDEAKSKPLESFDLIISDLRLPGAAGTEMITLAGATPVLIMTSYASLRSAVDTMRQGAVDYIAKPFDHEQMLQTVARITEQARHQQRDKQQTSNSKFTRFGIIGACDEMRDVFTHIEKSAPTDCNILIQGETGTGKELVAKAVHDRSLRQNGKLISVNCAAIPDTLIESELFGYAKGAFTGANTDREGLIEAADGGTLFLDEIGELPLEAQARLLRFLQEGEIRRIGSTHTSTVNVRVIAATHRDLKKLSDSGEFRQDLYFRLNVLPLKLPPLRQRGKDLSLIAEHFLKQLGEKYQKADLSLSAKAVQAIYAYQWPGNIRELENVIERSVILSHKPEISDQDLLIDIELVDVESDSSEKPTQNQDMGAMSMEEYAQRFILENQDQMSETEIAKKLGISRKSLWERRKRLGIPRKNS
ncbi:MAG: sigma-54-dependent Fis family transcriptional regulator [Pseudomonadales bacterium]|nr:sigma-54-dependent Fis family transcriptional regulator [Pseudomonadales bacterium]